MSLPKRKPRPRMKPAVPPARFLQDEAYTDLEREALSRVLEQVPDEAVVEYAKTHPDCCVGTRANRQGVPTIRQNLKLQIRGSKWPSEPLLNLLACASLSTRVIDVLSEAAIHVALDSMRVLYHGALLGEAMLLDRRKPVREIGRTLLREPMNEAPTDEEREAAQAEMQSAFQWFREEAGMLFGLNGAEGEDSVTRQLRSELEQQRARTEEAMREVERAKQKLERREEAAERDRENQQARDQFREQREEVLRAEVARLEQEVARIGREKAELLASFELRVNAGVEAGLSERIRPYMALPLKLDQALQTTRQRIAAGEDPVARASELLKQQHERDRTHRTRRMLEERLAEVLRLREYIAVARQQSLSPVDGLAEVERDLRAEAEFLAEKLQKPMPAQDYDELLARINQLERPEEYERLRSFVETGSGLRAWSNRQARALFVALDRKYSLLLEIFNKTNPSAALRRLPASVLRDALEQLTPVEVLLDGHNILHAMYEEEVARKVPEQELRARLEEAVVSRFAGAHSAEVSLYFDSPRHDRDSLSPQVKRIFSGGSGQHRADRVLLEDLQQRHDADPRGLRIVVSSDGGVIEEAKRLGALTMYSAEFEGLLPR